MTKAQYELLGLKRIHANLSYGSGVRPKHSSKACKPTSVPTKARIYGKQDFPFDYSMQCRKYWLPQYLQTIVNLLRLS